MTITSSSPITPDEVARHTFASVRRGFDPSEVRDYLESVATALRAMAEREQELRDQLADAEHRAANPVIDDVTLTEAVGKETARVLLSANEAAAEKVANAEAEAARLLAEATASAEQMTAQATETAEQAQARADALYAERTAEAEEHAAALRQQTDEQVAAAVERARAEAEGLLERARSEGRSMVEEAQRLRARVLADLGRRRKALHAQLEQLRAARERMAEAVGEVRRSIDGIADDLATAEDSARDAAEQAGREAAQRADEGLTDDELAALAAEAAAVSASGGDGEDDGAAMVGTDADTDTDTEDGLEGSASEVDALFAKIRAAREEEPAEAPAKPAKGGKSKGGKAAKGAAAAAAVTTRGCANSSVLRLQRLLRPVGLLAGGLHLVPELRLLGLGAGSLLLRLQRGGLLARGEDDLALGEDGDVVHGVDRDHALRGDRHVGPVEDDRRLARGELDLPVDHLDRRGRRAGVGLEAVHDPYRPEAPGDTEGGEVDHDVGHGDLSRQCRAGQVDCHPGGGIAVVPAHVLDQDVVSGGDIPAINAQTFTPSIDSHRFFRVTDADMPTLSLMGNALFSYATPAVQYTDADGTEHAPFGELMSTEHHGFGKDEVDEEDGGDGRDDDRRGERGYADGPAASARFEEPELLSIDAAGDLIVVEAIGRRRRIHDGIVTTVGR